MKWRRVYSASQKGGYEISMSKHVYARVCAIVHGITGREAGGKFESIFIFVCECV